MLFLFANICIIYCVHKQFLHFSFSFHRCPSFSQIDRALSTTFAPYNFFLIGYSKRKNSWEERRATVKRSKLLLWRNGSPTEDNSVRETRFPLWRGNERNVNIIIIVKRLSFFLNSFLPFSSFISPSHSLPLFLFLF